MFNDLDLDISELLPDVLDELGAKGKVEITNVTSTGYGVDPTSSMITFDDVNLTPPTSYVIQSIKDKFVISKGLECFALASEVTTQPISHKSYLTIYEGNLNNTAIKNNKMKITDVHPVMTGKVVNMYRLRCET